MANIILVVEDDKEINNLLCKALQNQGYTAKAAFTGTQGLELLKNEHFDMLVDIMLPYKYGDELLQELRSFSAIPVLVISAKETTQTKIDLLRLGADDYITKPFDIDEVIARIEANLRRNLPNAALSSNVLTYKDIRLDLSSKQIRVNGQEITLTATEMKILELFLSQPQKVFSKANLFESIWNEEYTVLAEKMGGEVTATLQEQTLNIRLSLVKE